MKSKWESVINQEHKKWYSWLAFMFLGLYWLLGFDGITFSDDVYYLLAGKNFWEGSMQINEYHFSSRWGAYIPSGLIGFLLEFDPHTISLVSLFSYVLTLGLLVYYFPNNKPLTVLLIWFCSHVYFLHFLTKVYPDGLLLLFCTIIPIAASKRSTLPISSGIILVLAFFMGFLTKETIILLLPLPLFLFMYDLKKGKQNLNFYISALIFGLGLSGLYMAYFWIEFGDPFYRVTSINGGHYISEFTYADKGMWDMIRRLTYLPVLTFIERAYWPWIVFAVPGIWLGFRSQNDFIFEFSLGFLCLLFGFWFMSSTLEFYNPIYLNPRHLIIFIPFLAFLIASGWKHWMQSTRWKRILSTLLLMACMISLEKGDIKMTVFQTSLIGLIWVQNLKTQLAFTAIILIIPALYSIYYQKELKQYKGLLTTLNKTLLTPENKDIIITNNFLNFSKKVLIPGQEESQLRLFPMEKVDELNSNLPPKIQVFIYEYYQHAYPKEQEDVEKLETWLLNNYNLHSEERTGNVWIRKYELQRGTFPD